MGLGSRDGEGIGFVANSAAGSRGVDLDLDLRFALLRDALVPFFDHPCPLNRLRRTVFMMRVSVWKIVGTERFVDLGDTDFCEGDVDTSETSGVLEASSDNMRHGTGGG